MGHRGMKRFSSTGYRHPLTFHSSGRPYIQREPLNPDACSSGSPDFIKMNNRTKKLKLQLSLSGEASRAQREAFSRATTYLAKIAVVLHDAPGQMLMFSQLMRKMVLPLASEDQKCIKNTIRVCLSTRKCFAKIPKSPDSEHSRGTCWKLDCSQITVKMVRRHFHGLLQLFPELHTKVGTVSTSRPPHLDFPRGAACKATWVGRQAKFTGPFSIKTLLSRDDPSRAAPGCGVQIIRAEQQHRQAEMKRAFSCCTESEEPLLHPSSGCFCIWPAGGSRFVTLGLQK